MGFKKHAGIDLHIHSTASDGSFTPAEILHHAQQLDLAAISITDHDTVAGSKEALEIGIPTSIDFLTGVEISAAPPPSYPKPGSFHILGYSIQLDDPALNKALETLQDARKNRNPEILNCLNELGFQITMADVQADIGDGQLGRPHIARCMVKKGFVNSINDAFDKYLGTGKQAYVDKYRIDCARAFEIIIGAGGIPVLAHPGLLEIDHTRQLEDLIIELKKMGLKGIEIFYPEHSPDQNRLFMDLANRHDLLITGGTDFHGTIQPAIKMGSGKGDLFVPYELYENLNQLGIQMELKDIAIIEQKLNYHFQNTKLLEEALRHSSYVNELADSKLRDNERFEFLGDAVLNLIVGHILMQRFPDLDEGELSRSRASLVNETQLAKMSCLLDFGDFIYLGKGEIQTKGREKNSILADTFEALMAAIYLDGGFQAVFEFIETNFQQLVEKIKTGSSGHDFKSQLQEFVQEGQGAMPNYRIAREDGPDHDKTFWVTLQVFETEVEGVGKSKKTAEQEAARKALEILKKET